MQMRKPKITLSYLIRNDLIQNVKELAKDGYTKEIFFFFYNVNVYHSVCEGCFLCKLNNINIYLNL